MISAFHDIEAVAIAVAITMVVSITVTLFAMQTRFDFTEKCWLVAICVCVALFWFGISCAIVGLFYKNISILQAIYGGLLIFSRNL